MEQTIGRKMICAAILVITAVFLSFADQTAMAGASGDYAYTVNTDGVSVTITGYTGMGGDVNIPDALDGKTVSGIGSDLFTSVNLTSITIPKSVLTIECGAFWECRSLQSIQIDADNPNYKNVDGIAFSKDGTVLVHYPAAIKGNAYTPPDTVTVIADNAFDHNQNLQSITLTQNVTQIGNSAFWRCDALTGFTIPQSVTTIGNSAFANCSLVTAFTVEAGNTAYKSMDGVLFDISGTNLLQCPAGKTGSYSVPAGVTKLKSGSFRGCSQLTNVTVSNDVTGIEDCVFAYCDNLTDVSLGEGIQMIGYAAFQGCAALTSITLPASITQIDNSVFDSCSSLLEAYFLGNAPAMGENVFSGCADSFTVYHLNTGTGFTNPWNGYQTAVFDLKSANQ
jgi:hypothetical protein